MDVTRQTVSKWEVGDSTPDLAKLAAIGELFGVSLDYLAMGRTSTASKLDALGQKVLTPENGRRVKRGALLAADAVSFLVYALVMGLPG